MANKKKVQAEAIAFGIIRIELLLALAVLVVLALIGYWAYAASPKLDTSSTLLRSTFQEGTSN